MSMAVVVNREELALEKEGWGQGGGREQCERRARSANVGAPRLWPLRALTAFLPLLHSITPSSPTPPTT